MTHGIAFTDKDLVKSGRFKVGDLVRLKKGKSKRAARIELFYSDIDGGVRLDREIDGFYSWNIEDLVKVKK